MNVERLVYSISLRSFAVDLSMFVFFCMSIDVGKTQVLAKGMSTHACVNKLMHAHTVKVHRLIVFVL